jgi:hypothetical protein
VRGFFVSIASAIHFAYNFVPDGFRFYLSTATYGWLLINADAANHQQ